MNKSKYGNTIVHCEIDGQPYRFKSRMEYRFALYLEWLRQNGDIMWWSYEPQTFEWTNQKGNKVQYRPDFKVLEKTGVAPCGMIECKRMWYEIKGYMTAAAKSKLKGFEKHYPNEKLVLIDAPWFIKNAKKLKGLVPGWE